MVYILEAPLAPPMFHHIFLLLVSTSLSSSLSLNEPMINSVMFNQWLNSRRLLFLHSHSREWINSANQIFIVSLTPSFVCLMPPASPFIPSFSWTCSKSTVSFPFIYRTSSPHPFCSHRLCMLFPVFSPPLLSVSLSLCVWVWQNAALAGCKETEPGRHDNLKMKGWEKTLSAKIAM